MASTPSRALPAAEPSVAGHAEQQGCHECRMLADAPVLHLVGHILFVRERTLMAQPVDPNSLQPAGDVFPVIEQVSSTFSYKPARPSSLRLVSNLRASPLESRS